MKKKMPAFKTDEEAARFLDRKDLSDYINAENMMPARFEFERKTKNLTMRIPATLLDAVKAHAVRQGIPYQRFIRQTLERVVMTVELRAAPLTPASPEAAVPTIALNKIAKQPRKARARRQQRVRFQKVK
jgi:predicted DNA binding CopG/RHH family protein